MIEKDFEVIRKENEDGREKEEERKKRSKQKKSLYFKFKRVRDLNYG